jgi:hypothetical protein
MAADVNQKRRCSADGLQFRRINSPQDVAIAVNERGRAMQLELAQCLAEIIDNTCKLPVFFCAALIGALVRIELFDEDNFVTKPLQPQHPAEAHPGLASIEGFIRNRAANDSKLHSVHQVALRDVQLSQKPG